MKKIFLALFFSGLIAVAVWAGNYGSYTTGTSVTFTWDHTADCDSARAYFGYPTKDNLYYNIKMTPDLIADSSLLSAPISLDSIGTHYVRIDYYEQGATSISGRITGAYEKKAAFPDSVAAMVSTLRNVAAAMDADDSSFAVYYVSPLGDNSNGRTPATAWNSPNSANSISSPAKPIRLYIGPGEYTLVACSLKVDVYSEVIGSGKGITNSKGIIDTTHNSAWPEAVYSYCPPNGFGDGMMVRDMTITQMGMRFSDPSFMCGIWFEDSTKYAGAHNVDFVGGYKDISSDDDGIYWLDVQYCDFFRPFIHAIDVAAQGGLIAHNIFIGTRDTAGIGVYDAIQIYTKGKHIMIYDNSFFGQQNAISFNGADSCFAFGNYAALSEGTHFLSVSAGSVDNKWGGNWGPNLSVKGVDAGKSQGNTVQEEMRDYWEQVMMMPLPGSIIRNGYLQIDVNGDSTDLAGWGSKSGTQAYLTSRRAFEGMERSLYLDSSSYNTQYVRADSGLYMVYADIYLPTLNDRGYFQCYYYSSNTALTWVAGGTVQYATGWTGWQKFSRLIRLPSPDSTYYFTIGTNTDDSAYFGSFGIAAYHTFDPTTSPVVAGDTTATGKILGLMPGEWSAADSFAFQGAGSNLSASAIADTFAARGYFTGLGDKQLNFLVLDSADSTAIQGASLIPRPLGGGTPFCRRLTGVNGRTIAHLDSGVVQVHLWKQGWEFNPVDTVAVLTDGQTDTLWGTLFAPTPGPATMTDVFTWITTPGGDTIYPSYLSYQLVDSLGNDIPKSMRVTYGSGSNQVLLATGVIEITADSSLFDFSLYANENLIPTWTKYRFIARYMLNRKPYQNTELTTAIPDTTNVNPFAQ